MATIDIAGAQQPVVLAIDVGSSSVRALLYDGRGDQIDGSEKQLPYSQTMTADGGSESNPATLLELVCHCIDHVATTFAHRPIPISAVAMTSFWHGLMGVDNQGTPSTPVYMWSDKRSGADAIRLGQELDGSAIHQRTGCRIHSSYWPAKLRWIERVRPGQYRQTRKWVSITDYLMQQFSGTLATSVSLASGTGLMNGLTCEWDPQMLDALGIGNSNLPPIIDRSDPYGPLGETYSSRWPALANIPWFPAIGDGAAANVGAGCVGDNRIAMTIGTSAAMRIIVEAPAEVAPAIALPPRIWSYRLDRRYAVLGGALSNGGNVTGWMASHMADGDFEHLTSDAETVAPDGHGLTILPFLAGERSPSWNENATGTIAGLRLSTTTGDLFRATLEATAYRLAAIYDDLVPLTATVHEIHANGGAALSSPLWLQIIADTLGHAVDAVDAEAEASARGAALCALESLGALPGFATIANGVSRRYVPNAEHYTAYLAARQRQSTLEAAITGMVAADAAPGT